VTIEENAALARDTYRVRFQCPEIAAKILPGQFLMLRLAGCDDPLLGRPFALYDTVLDPDGRPTGLDVVYLVVGKMTGRLSELGPGERLEVWGPLGNGFPPTQTEHLVMVAGGIGQTPFVALAREFLGLGAYGDPPRQVPKAQRATLCYGVRSREYLAGTADFEAAGVEVRLSTEDGSLGHRGLVTELVQPAIEESPLACRIVCCGPEPMIEAAAEIAAVWACPARSRWRRRWRAGSGSALAAWRGSATGPGAGTTAGPAWRGRSSRPPTCSSEGGWSPGAWFRPA
jgi:dihydroorotate dehydrogenase electron transfer subunit